MYHIVTVQGVARDALISLAGDNQNGSVAARLGIENKRLQNPVGLFSGFAVEVEAGIYFHQATTELSFHAFIDARVGRE